MKYYRDKYGYDGAKYPVATELSDHAIALPVGPHLGRLEHRHGAEVADAVASAGAVEPVDHQDVAARQVQQPGRGHVDPGAPHRRKAVDLVVKYLHDLHHGADLRPDAEIFGLKAKWDPALIRDRLEAK